MATPVILHRYFKDIDELGEVLSSRRQVRLTKLSRGLFESNLLFVEFEEAQFFFTSSLNSVRCIGEKSAGYLGFSCVIESGDGNIISHGYQLSDNTLFGFDPNREVDLVIPSNLKFCNVLIKRELFEDCLEVMEREDIDQHFLSLNFCRFPSTMIILQAYLKQMWYLLKKRPHFLKLPQLKKLVLNDFIPLLIDAIPPNHKSVIKPMPSQNRAQIVKEAEEFMIAHLEQPITLKDLCQILNVSSRPLFYGFQEMFGVNPMTYLKIQRLHAVRRLLKVANLETTSVMEISNQFGFWSAGHFARDYKIMFGELPSETLKNGNS